MKSFWKEIHASHEEKNPSLFYLTRYIDAWETDDEDEEGKVICKIKLSKDSLIVNYLDMRAIVDEYAQSVIQKACKEIYDRNNAGRTAKSAAFVENDRVDNGINDVFDDTTASNVCPECGVKSSVEHEGGCVVCRNCGFSKCG